MEGQVPEPTSGGTRLHVVVARDDGTATVALEGELDLATADLLPPTPDHPLQGVHAVVVDCGRLRFCDSAGVRALNELRLAVERSGGSVTLHDPSPMLARVLDIAGLGSLFRGVDGPSR
ncbi:MAG TPA: STAS domain-containing protein [Acidimicrobiales bacterium]|nr:STAS domain-containing protein [Acidimicrobiales bacterium]